MTFTRVHTYITFANPHLVCVECHATARRWHDGERCGCEAGCWLAPCGHRADTVSASPSWSPVH